MKIIVNVIIGIVSIGIISISVAGILFLQNNSEDYETIFFTLQGDNTVSSFPNKNNWVAGEKMTYVSTIENGLLVLATSSASDTVFAFNGETGESITTFNVGKIPKGVKIRPDGNFAFVANEGSDSVTIIDLILGKIPTEIPVGKNPHNIIFHPTDDLAFVTLQGEDKIAVIDSKRFEVISLIPVNGLPHKETYHLEIYPNCVECPLLELKKLLQISLNLSQLPYPHLEV